MPVKVTFTGFAELEDQLRNLPAFVTTLAHQAVRKAAEETKTELIQNYPQGKTGQLRSGVVSRESERNATFGITVLSLAPHAKWWEQGTKVRSTAKGYNRGSITDHRTQGLIAVADRHRNLMNLELSDAVRSTGLLTVEGDLL